MEFATLSNGQRMPLLGYGVFRIDDARVQACVEDALSVGYRLIDVAQAYGNERGVGAAIAASGIPRSDLLLMDKVWIANYGPGRTYDSIKRSLELLGADYLDMALLHFLFGDYYSAWRDMERALADGLVRGIGTANFDAVRLADLRAFNSVAPVANQVETHVFCQQENAGAAMRALGVRHMGWAPLAEGANGLFDNPLLVQIGKAHGKTAAQVALRFLVDRGIPVAVGSTNRPHLELDLDVLDFRLTEEEHARIAALDGAFSLVEAYNDPAFATPWLSRIAGR
ncbi:MAG: aldo/keto reductase [Eggerthellaceae bacterium]|jgi:2,5-diketo-D-gluconate reductase A